MAEFAQMGNMEIWYARLTEKEIMDAIATLTKGAKTKEAAAQAKTGAQRAQKNVEKAHTRDSLQALSKLAEVVDGRYRIVSQPPVVIPARDLEAMYGYSADEIEEMIHQQFRAYRATLQEDRRHLLERFEIVDMARKVVGVGSVGTRAFIVLLQGRDEQDPLVPPGQGSHGLGARGPPAQEQVQRARRAGGPRPTADAGGQRHLSRMDQGGRGQSPSLLATAA